MTELQMREHIESRIFQKNYTNIKGKKQSLERGSFSNKLISDGVFVVADAILTEATIKRRGRKNKILTVIEEFLGKGYLQDEDNVISLSLSLIELVLSKLYLDDRKITMRMSVAYQIVEKLLGGDRLNNEHTQVAVSLFETVVDALPFVSSESFFENGEKKIIYSLDPEAQDKLKYLINNFIRDGYYPMPMTEKPVDWQFINGELIGGYQSLKTPLIRSNKISMPKSMFNPKFLDGSLPLQALNAIQSVAFRINKGNLERVGRDLKMPDAPLIPDGFKEWGADWHEYKEDKKIFEQFGGEEPTKPEVSKEQHEIFVNYMSAKQKYISDVGKYNTDMLSLQIATELQNEERIYFPHNFDYRGRMYPIPIGLNPQGNDVAKGLLEFADPVELNISGIRQSVAYLASTYGFDKECWETRYHKGMELLQSQSVDYLNAEEPYVFCQVWELLQRVNNGDRESRIAIAIDGSCNGLQHMSAITLDKQGGVNVNVSKEKNRYDIYQIIADETSRLMRIRLGELRCYGAFDDKEEFELSILPDLIEIMLSDKSRKIAKRPVMINPYGGTFNGYKGYVLDALKTLFPIHGNNKSAGILTKYINEAMKQNLKGGGLYKKWSSEVFKSIAINLNSHKEGTVYFHTPDGFKVNNFMYTITSKVYDIKSLVNRSGSRKVKLQSVTDEVNTRKISTAIQPNIIHSLDATHLRMTALSMVKCKVEQLWFIHDSFATNPNEIELLNRVTREEFVKLYDVNSEVHPLPIIYRDIEKQLGSVPNSFPIFQGVDRMDINDVKENEFFFA